MKTGVIGDLHLKDNLNYSEYIKDGRVSEKQEVLDFIVDQLKDCEKIVMLGDQLNSRNNSAKVMRDFTALVERFEDKEVYIISGNHEKFGDGRTSIDFLSKIKGKNWHVITNGVDTFGGMTFLPYLSNPELDVFSFKQASERILSMLPTKGDILFLHHTITNMVTTHGTSTNDFYEALLPQKELEKRFGLVVSGHIHKPQKSGKTIVAGSIFTNEVNELEKFIWKIDNSDLTVEDIKLPVRPIYKIENQTAFAGYDKRSIAKIIISDEKLKDAVKEIKEKAKEAFEAVVLVEQYPNKRRKLHTEDNILKFSVDELLSIYAKEKKIELSKLKQGFKLIT